MGTSHLSRLGRLRQRLHEAFRRRQHRKSGYAQTPYGLLRAADWSHYIGLMATGYWEPMESKVIERLVRGRVFWDLGAHYGYYLLAAKAAGAGRIFAIEASPPAFQSLQETARINQIDANLLQRALVHDETLPEFVDFFVGNTSDASLYSSTHVSSEAYHRVQVPTANIESLLKVHGWAAPDFVLVDLEGSEPWVVPQLLKHCPSRPDLLVEVNFRACAAHDALPFAFVQALLDHRDVVAELVEKTGSYRRVTNPRTLGSNVNLIGVSNESWMKLQTSV